MPRSLSLWNFSLVLWHFAPFPSQFHIHESHYINSITACYSSLFIPLYLPLHARHIPCGYSLSDSFDGSSMMTHTSIL